MMGKTRRFISHLLHPVQGEIWCLHRVVDNRSVYPGNRELEITPGYLKDLLLQYKNKGFDFVSVDELLGKRSLWPRKRVNISFFRCSFTVSSYGSENLGWTTFYFQLYDADSGSIIEGGQGSFTYHAI